MEGKGSLFVSSKNPYEKNLVETPEELKPSSYLKSITFQKGELKIITGVVGSLDKPHSDYATAARAAAFCDKAGIPVNLVVKALEERGYSAEVIKTRVPLKEKNPRLVGKIGISPDAIIAYDMVKKGQQRLISEEPVLEQEIVIMKGKIGMLPDKILPQVIDMADVLRDQNSIQMNSMSRPFMIENKVAA